MYIIDYTDLFFCSQILHFLKAFVPKYYIFGQKYDY